ncbi:uncharacterized protein PITG_04217 [Phytophthora infestans T30-4]|uniref:Uncharacterized protein n=1 Tax=Phytophthora infestans (strain T30-4) TaxID=403677 RepID=D0N0T2_PHYIT|nr:uncharacterized protein PITG_04217 [Phytophthora infestans T30-4]EEY67245.1 conserved hypothetical protein [Phytophthora infestans T30-4]|eukprot:XP_002905893.1 conserved hypothetical protein [Phytophthora infestans T30-4]
MKLMFPGLPNRLEYIAEFCLASLVYHSSFLKATLSPQHHLFETPLFQDEELLLNLTTRIRTGDGCAAARIRPTGVPPHVAILCEMKGLKDGLLESVSKIEATRLDTVQDIISELEKRAIGAGTVTYDGNEGQLCHYWSGKFRRVPADFTIPDCSVRHVWVLWMCGNKKMQKRFSQLRFVMLKIEKDATSKELSVALSWATVGKLLRKKAKTTSS